MSAIWSSVSVNFGIPRSPGVDDRRDQLTVLIVEHDAGAQQARSAVAAARVGAVAELAVDAVQRLAALDSCGIGWRAVGIIAPLSGDQRGAEQQADDDRANASLRPATAVVRYLERRTLTHDHLAGKAYAT